jgi:magnesium chelatase subunit I
LKQRCERARLLLPSIPLDDQALAEITERCFAAGVDGLRADLVWLRAARAHAAWRGTQQIITEDIDAVAEFALRHRRRTAPPPASQQSPASQNAAQQPASEEGGQGSWGEMPAQAVPVGARREVPSWPKKP